MYIFPDAKILEINLSLSEVSIKILPGDIYRLYPGGSALGMYLLLKEQAPNIEPFSEENLLIFSVSPLTGLPISGQSRMCVTSKSPLTGTAASSEAGGYLPAYIKASGYDAIVIKGKSKKPVYIYIDGGNVEIKDAKNVWGKITGEAEKIIKEELGQNQVEIAQIGPSGEKLVRFACILNMCNRANGRNGLGAVMGSKNLKALVVKKGKTIKPSDPEGFKKLTHNAKDRYDEASLKSFTLNGTDDELEGTNSEGYLVTNNWQSGYFPGGSQITGSAMTEKILVGRETCYACMIRCKRKVEVPDKVDPYYGGPEYETCATFGSYCGNDSIEIIAEANQICNMYGVDTISAGATIAFAMECYKNNIISKDSTEGLELNFGNGKSIIRLLEKICMREGIGDLLAEGSYRAALAIGKDAIQYSMSVKKQEMPAHMPQFKSSLGIVYAMNPFGADHESSAHDGALLGPPDSRSRKRLGQLGIIKGYDNYEALDEGKVEYAFTTQKFFSILDTLCLCQFAWGPTWQLYGPEDLYNLCKYGIGWETSLYELMSIGERRINMMRYFNAREGFSSNDDILPERLFQPFTDGPAKGASLNKEKFEHGKKRYYEMAGWDPITGNPTDATLKSLKLGWLLHEEVEKNSLHP